MNETTTKPNWNLLLEEYDNSGMSARAFALSKDIKPASFHWQLRKRANHAAKDVMANTDTPVFIPVVTKETSFHSKSKISIIINDVSINIEPGFSPQLLAEVVQVLKSTC